MTPIDWDVSSEGKYTLSLLAVSLVSKYHDCFTYLFELFSRMIL